MKYVSYFFNDKLGIINYLLNVGVYMPVVQLVDTIKQRKQELGYARERYFF